MTMTMLGSSNGLGQEEGHQARMCANLLDHQGRLCTILYDALTMAAGKNKPTSELARLSVRRVGCLGAAAMVVKMGDSSLGYIILRVEINLLNTDAGKAIRVCRKTSKFPDPDKYYLESQFDQALQECAELVKNYSSSPQL